jgi:hypothetical protein
MNEKIEKTQTSNFRIEIDGHLGDQRSRQFEDFRVVSLADGRTLISGSLHDQAQLFGMLILIRIGLEAALLHHLDRSGFLSPGQCTGRLCPDLVDDGDDWQRHCPCYCRNV